MTDQPIFPVGPHELVATGSLGGSLLALNNAHAEQLSWLEPERLVHLVERAFLALRIGYDDAFLLAFDQDADYDGLDFLWFRARYKRFVYVDRIAVAAHARGRGNGRRLYHHLFERACEAGHERVVCEVNSKPPNTASDAFHAAMGFTEVGTGTHPGGGKIVKYFSHQLVRPTPAT
jgi:predicted GNAT superfamily acetyltransferase